MTVSEEAFAAVYIAPMISVGSLAVGCASSGLMMVKFTISDRTQIRNEVSIVRSVHYWQLNAYMGYSYGLLGTE